jgi:alkylation response protein AidB-like acyl-CoA dehydrogenase
MDFGFDADQEALRELARKALANAADPWAELARAGLTSVMLPVEQGGAGLGIVEQCLVFEQAGRAAAPAALVPSLIAGAALGRMGASDDLDRVTLALHELGPALTIARPPERSERNDRWKLDGVKVAVPALERAAQVLMPARLAGGGVALARVATDARGLKRDAGVSTDESTVYRLTCDGVIVDDAAVLTGARAGELRDWLRRHVTVGFAAYELGIAARQLEMTAEHVVRRQQFGKPIGLFQAVGQRCADMHIDVESLRLAVWEAAHLLASDGKSAATVDAAVATAAFWAADAGARVAAAAQHLHGGIGFDRAYPLYRYYLAAKRVELELGGATQQLAQLGKILATEAQT